MASDNSIDYSALDYNVFKEAIRKALAGSENKEEVSELTDKEKQATIKAKQADIEAKQIALKSATDALNKAKAAQVDQK